MTAIKGMHSSQSQLMSSKKQQFGVSEKMSGFQGLGRLDQAA